MPFHRFEAIESKVLTAHLSSGRAPIIEGEYLYFCLNQKEAGTGSELHYHPNELLIFVVRGKVNAVVGKDRRIVGTGTFILIPPNVRHSMKATEDGPCAYLYIKDQTWTVVGVAADEALPDRPMTMEESQEIVRQNGRADAAKRGESQAIVEGVPDCYYPLLSSLDAPLRCGRRIEWIKGEREAFGFFEVPGSYREDCDSSQHEQFLYVLSGSLDAEVDGSRKGLTEGGIAQIPKGSAYRLSVHADEPTRFVIVRSTHWLEEWVDRTKEKE